MGTNTYLSGSTAAALAAATIPDNFSSNGDGTYTYLDSAGGNPLTFTSAELIGLADNGDATWTMTLPDGTSAVDIDINDAFGNLTATGVTNLIAALDFTLLSSIQQQDIVTALAGNPSAIAALAAALGSDSIADLGDGTYSHTAFDGSVIVIDTNAGSANLQDVAGNFTATNIEDALVEIATSLVATSDTDVSAAAINVVGSDVEVRVTEDGVDQVGLLPLATLAGAFPAGSILAAALALGADTDVSAVAISVVGTNLQVGVSESGTDYSGTIPLSVIAAAFPAGSIVGGALAAGLADTDVTAADLSVSGTDLQVTVTEDGLDVSGLVALSAIAAGFPNGSIPPSAISGGVSNSDTDVSAAALGIVGTNLEVSVNESGLAYTGLLPLTTLASALPAESIPVSALPAGTTDTDVSNVSLSVVGTDLEVRKTEDGVDVVGLVPLSSLATAGNLTVLMTIRHALAMLYWWVIRSLFHSLAGWMKRSMLWPTLRIFWRQILWDTLVHRALVNWLH